MNSTHAELLPVRDGLLRVGFDERRLRPNFPVPNFPHRFADLVGFADDPLDSRTAMVAAVRGTEFSDPDIFSLRPLGASLVFQCFPDFSILWKQGIDRPHVHCRLNSSELPAYFEANKEVLAPDSLYRAKVWGRINHSFQLDFIDVGLLPLIEEEAGQKLAHLIARMFSTARKLLQWQTLSASQSRWLLKAVFWLLAAKILKDKQVPGFVRMNLTEIEDVYTRLAKHYDSAEPQPIRISSQQRREALAAAAELLVPFADCQCVSTEALGFLYESALVDRVTRQKLGIHSTPGWMVDYIVGLLRPWIEQDITTENRRVFEPACGHAAFLISAMRLLSELLPGNWHESRKTYLRKRLYGVEKDPFALEIARLSLTLADVPNRNGWLLSEGDMFQDSVIEQGSAKASIVLANPPFENFGEEKRSSGSLNNKAAETFRRTLDSLIPGAVFGFVLPQSFLHSKEASDVRKRLLEGCELKEISLFSDKVFRYGEPESVVLVGRRKKDGAQSRSVIHYNRIREAALPNFRKTLRCAASELMPQSDLQKPPNYSVYVPDLQSVWKSLGELPQLKEFADIGKGFEHKSRNNPTRPAGAVIASRAERPGLVPGFKKWDSAQQSHLALQHVWLNLNDDVIKCHRRGTTQGIPQILFNYSRVSRGPWRIEAVIDPVGRPFTSRFVAVRPFDDHVSLQVLWAVINSPIGNAFAYSSSMKRDNLPGMAARLPVPDFRSVDLTNLTRAVTAYFLAASKASHWEQSPEEAKNARDCLQRKFVFDEEAEEGDRMQAELKYLHWKIDLEVLRLYNLDHRQERQLLDLFQGCERRGVPFEQAEYFPEDFTALDRLSDLLAITGEWEQTNDRRAELLDREEMGTLTADEAIELADLQRLADARVDLLKPVQMADADEIIERLKREGLWRSSIGGPL